MSHPLFEKHRELIEQACKAARTRGYWSPFNEMPSPKTYGENAAAESYGQSILSFVEVHRCISG